MHRSTRHLALLFTASALASCSDSPASPPAPVTVTVALNGPDHGVTVGDSVQLTYTAASSDGSPVQGPATWSTQNPTVATVSSTGMVHALAEGTASISVSVQGSIASTDVAVLGRPQIRSVSLKSTHACLLDDGRAYCWGNGDGGRLGVGTEPFTGTPLEVSGGLTFQQLAAGFTHTCGVTTEGAAYCWGDNDFGKIGDTGPFDVPAPTRVVTPVRFTSVAPGGVNTCALTGEGLAYCWGRVGGSGTGASGNESLPRPQQVEGNITFRQLSGGFTHTCGVSVEGTAYCWGIGSRGQLTGSEGDREALTPVRVPYDGTFVQISAGYLHTCGVADTGDALCWGLNDYGQSGKWLAEITAVRPVAGGLTFSSVSAGYIHSCGVTPSGAGYCWGNNTAGRLGDGTESSGYTPRRVAGDLLFSSIEAGQNMSCGVSGGAWYCWGNNTYGQLGAGTLGIVTEPTAPQGLPPIRRISSGTDHTCALDLSGNAYCWGSNRFGQLGGSGTEARFPTAVPGHEPFADIAAGGEATCATTPDGRGFCWGWGYLAADPYSDRVDVPTAVLPEHQVRNFAVGESHVCALDGDGVVSCWGNGVYGQLGDGVRDNRWLGAPVAGDERFVAVASGGDASCGIVVDGRLLCWGRNEFGQLGNGTTVNATTPTEVQGGLRFIAVSLGQRHACAVTEDRARYCWGSAADGRTLVGGPDDNVLVPTPLGDLGAPGSGWSWYSVSAGRAHTCALAIQGATCWGSNGLGAISDLPYVRTSFDEITAGDDFSCGLRGETVLCWGLNSVLQTGVPTLRFSLEPVRVSH